MKKLSLVFFLPILMWSQNLSDLITISQENKLVKSSQQNLESIEDDFSSTKKSYLPSLSIGGNYSNTNHETASVPDNSVTSYAKLNYTLYDGNKKSNLYKGYESSIKSSQESIYALKNEIALDVVNYYYSYLSLLANKDAKLKEIEQLESEAKRVKNFVDVGSSTTDEFDKINSRIQSSNVDLNQIELDIQTISHTLEYITGNEVNITEGSLIREVNINEKQERADIKALEYNLDKLVSDAKTVKSEKLPQINITNTYTYYDQNYKNKNYENDLNDQNVLAVNLSWKIFDFDATNKKYSSKYKTYLSQKSQYEYQKNKANIDLKLAIKSYDITKTKIKAAQSALKAATSTYESIKSKYQNGLIDNVSFLEALSEKYNALSALKSSEYELEVKKANILFYSGKNIEEYIQ